MQIILLSGGSGQRLWPLSNEIRSKQFLKIFNEAGGESMLQAFVFDRHLQGRGLMAHTVEQGAVAVAALLDGQLGVGGMLPNHAPVVHHLIVQRLTARVVYRRCLQAHRSGYQ